MSMKGGGGVCCIDEFICHSERAYSRQEIWNRQGLGAAALLHQLFKSGDFAAQPKTLLFQTKSLSNRDSC